MVERVAPMRAEYKRLSMIADAPSILRAYPLIGLRFENENPRLCGHLMGLFLRFSIIAERNLPGLGLRPP